MIGNKRKAEEGSQEKGGDLQSKYNPTLTSGGKGT